MVASKKLFPFRCCWNILWIPAFAGMTLCFSLLLNAAFAQATGQDSIYSTKRGAGSVTAGSIGSTVRSPKDVPQVSAPDPMLNTDTPTPDSAISTSDMTSSDPTLSTTQPSPRSDISTKDMSAKDPMLSTTMKSPASAISTGDPKIDPRVCNALTKHTPNADVAYQPGVDINGNAVKPADVPGAPQMKLPDRIDIPLTLSLAKTLNLDTSKYPYNQLGPGTEAQLGMLSVEGDRVTFNGRPISDTQQDNLSVICMKQGGDKP